MILRTQYLERIRPFYDSELIKVITGVRRCGKSVLLRQIADEIRAEHFDSTEPDTLVFVDFDDYANRELTDPDKLYRFIKPKLSDERKPTCFLMRFRMCAISSSWLIRSIRPTTLASF